MSQSQTISSEWLYDRILLPSAGANSTYPLFAVGIGGQDPNAAAGVQKTIVDTNLPNPAGKLGKPESFLVQGINAFCEIGTAILDQQIVAVHCEQELKLSNNTIVVWRLPCDFIPAGTGFFLNVTNALGQIGVPSLTNCVVLDRPPLIDIEETFSCPLVFDTAPKSLSTGFSVTAPQWRMILRGPHALVYAQDGKTSPLLPFAAP